MNTTYQRSLAQPDPPMKTYLGFNLERRRTRRLFVGLLVACYALIAASLWAAAKYNKLLLLGVVAGLVVIGVLYAGLSQAMRAYSFTSSMRPRENPLTDERQAQVRDRAFVSAYQALAAACSFGVMYWMLAFDFLWPLPHEQYQVQIIFWGVLILTACLPTAIVAWGELGLDD
jgi:hypothetical protein